jgi:hypothetical protein
MEELQNTLDVQTSWDPTAAGGKAENVVHLRLVNELKKSGFIDRLYNEGQVKSPDKSFPSGRIS